jgi:hypothetical protein
MCSFLMGHSTRKRRYVVTSVDQMGKKSREPTGGSTLCKMEVSEESRENSIEHDRRTSKTGRERTLLRWEGVAAVVLDPTLLCTGDEPSSSLGISGPCSWEGECRGSVTWTAGRLCVLAESRMLAEGLPDIGEGPM